MSSTAARIAQIFENLYTAILVFDSELCVLNMNTSAEGMLSISFRKAKGLKAEKVLPNSTRFVDTIRRSLEATQVFTEREVKLRLHTGQSITVDCIFTPLLSKECYQVIVELYDTQSLTRIIREESLSILHNVAKESLRGMAHEIKNPLGGLRGAAQLLEQELNGNNLIEYTSIIISEADRLGKLIDRMIAPDDRLNQSNVNIHEILDYVQNLLEAESDISINIVRDYDPGLPKLVADREQLVQAILNIIKNSMQAVAEDGHIRINTRIKRKCTIRRQLFKLAVQIEVIDNGPGVDTMMESSIFYPMVTGRAEGTGLGLSIAQSIIQSHEGHIEYERRDEQTIFRILLPLRLNDD